MSRSNKAPVQALKPMDVRSAKGVADLLQGMSQTAIGARNLGEAFEVLKAMADDTECTKVATVSGAMSVAKMSPLLREMIDLGLANIIVCTGAFLTHELAETLGGFHIPHDPSLSDYQLYCDGYNRIYDSLEADSNLIKVYDFIGGLLCDLETAEGSCSVEINRTVGKKLLDLDLGSNVLAAAYRKGVPIYVPAFTDSEIGLALAVAKMRAQGLIRDKEFSHIEMLPLFNPYRDLFDYVERIVRAKRLGIFTVGGGVPRNWAQQAPPFIDMINYSTGLTLEFPQFIYGIRICPEPEHWGGLSGCSYNEGVSWGKFIPREKGGRFAEVHCDATIAWPFLIRGLIEYLG